tara:strand:+ start:242 stop:517 length:276 start_codon:yes stop_codon:yes gene_type:complete
MGQLKMRTVTVIKHKLALEEMSRLGVDVSSDMARCEKDIDFLVGCMKVVEPIEYYRRRKRWKGSLTDKQKDVIRKNIKTHSDVEIAGMLQG